MLAIRRRERESVYYLSPCFRIYPMYICTFFNMHATPNGPPKIPFTSDVQQLPSSPRSETLQSDPSTDRLAWSRIQQVSRTEACSAPTDVLWLTSYNQSFTVLRPENERNADRVGTNFLVLLNTLASSLLFSIPSLGSSRGRSFVSSSSLCL